MMVLGKIFGVVYLLSALAIRNSKLVEEWRKDLKRPQELKNILPHKQKILQSEANKYRKFLMC